MPISTSGHISHCLSLILSLAPRSVLDVGCGFGLWGFLCREYLDVARARVRPQDWQIRIDGIELFEPYIMDHQRALYDRLIIADIREAAPRIDAYDLIIAGDVIEHLEKREGEEVLRHLYDRALRALLVNIPLGPGWDHPEAYGNPGELHRSRWEVEDFLAYPCTFQEFRIPTGARYGVFFCRKDAPCKQQIEPLLHAARRCEASGDPAGAARHLRQAHLLDPGDDEVALYLADVLLKRNAAEEAVHVLLRCASMNARFRYGSLAAARILAGLGRKPEAGEVLEDLLSRQEEAEESLLVQARDLLASLG
ncbi:MAG: tetratricopeptide repeat protein [bacterium]